MMLVVARYGRGKYCSHQTLITAGYEVSALHWSFWSSSLSWWYDSENWTPNVTPHLWPLSTSLPPLFLCQKPHYSVAFPRCFVEFQTLKCWRVIATICCWCNYWTIATIECNQVRHWFEPMSIKWHGIIQPVSTQLHHWSKMTAKMMMFIMIMRIGF